MYFSYHKLKKNIKITISFSKKKQLRERGRRAETGKNAGSISTDNCKGNLLQQYCLQRVPRLLDNFST